MRPGNISNPTSQKAHINGVLSTPFLKNPGLQGEVHRPGSGPVPGGKSGPGSRECENLVQAFTTIPEALKTKRILLNCVSLSFKFLRVR